MYKEQNCLNLAINCPGFSKKNLEAADDDLALGLESLLREIIRLTALSSL